MSGTALVVVIALVLLGIFDADELGEVAAAGVHWVSLNTGWFFTILTITVFAFMLIVGYSSKGNIPLGTDDEAPEFSTGSWIAMLFSAGMGIGLLFFGSYEPLHFFLNTPPEFSATPGSPEAMNAAIGQTLLHWGPFAWSFYALVGGAIAYSAYRRGRFPLISAIFTPIFNERLEMPLGRVIDTFAILVTLFGTAVSGVKRGIRILSNINMVVALVLSLFVFIAGPTLFLLDFIPSALVAFVGGLPAMLSVSASSSTEAAAFMESWTTYYWAWWVSWTPFVGMFIARISRGRTLREFVTVVIIIPSIVCLLWFSIMGGTSMWMEMNGAEISAAQSSQEYLFRVLDNLPFTALASVVAMFSLTIFFVTSADSASLVMATTSQSGKSNPDKKLTVVWGVSLSAVAITLLVAGGEETVSALQALVTIAALPFAIILVFLMVAWWKDLSTDPLVLRRKYATVAIEEGVRKGIRQHGDAFAFSAGVTEPDRGAGSWLDQKDSSLTDWYEDVARDRDEDADQKAAEGTESAKSL